MSDLIVWSPGVKLDAIERQVIERAIKFYQGNKTATAQALGISIRTLDGRLEQYEIDAKKEKERYARDDANRQYQLDRARGIVTPGNVVAVQTPEPQIRQQANSPQANAGVRVEPAPHIAAERPVSVPERQEVQSVPFQHAASGGNRKRR